MSQTEVRAPAIPVVILWVKCFGVYNIDESSELVYCRHQAGADNYHLHAWFGSCGIFLSQWLSVIVSSVGGKAVFEESGVKMSVSVLCELP